MDINKQMLETRITIVMARENYSFLHKISEYKIKLKEYFLVEYGEAEIGKALRDIEEAYMQHEYDKLQQIIEIPEDFELR